MTVSPEPRPLSRKARLVLWLVRRLGRTLRWSLRHFRGWLWKLTKLSYWRAWLRGTFWNGVLVVGGILLWEQLPHTTNEEWLNSALTLGLYCFWMWPLVSALRR